MTTQVELNEAIGEWRELALFAGHTAIATPNSGYMANRLSFPTITKTAPGDPFEFAFRCTVTIVFEF
jgi:hypothetical protein